jgi:hypothetical protein
VLANIGNVYKITEDGVTTDLFIGGAGQTIHIGDNAVVVYGGQTTDTFLFDLQSGSIDLTPYQTKALESAIEGATTVEGALGALSTNKATQAEVNDIVNVLGAKNLFDGSIVTTTAKGVTFTQNADGTISVTGYNTQGSSLGIFANHIQKLKAGSYVLSGCPSPTSGGLHIQLSDNDAGVIIAEIYDGNETSFSLNADTNCKIMYWGSGDLSITGTLIIKPMIRLASDPDNTYQPYTMTNQQITPYVQAISNPNLLDNPWFTVNQRGTTSWSSGYGVDRWMPQRADITVNADKTLTITPTELSTINGYIGQRIEKEASLLGKTVTISALLSNGTITSHTFDTIEDGINNAVEGNYNFGYSTTTSSSYDLVWFGLRSKSTIPSVTIKAIKLELGSVSTLAMDTAPNYQQELAKCQRYFVRYASTANNSSISFGAIATVNKQWYGVVSLPVVMRTTPTITYDGTIFVYFEANTALNQNVLSIAISNMMTNVGKLRANFADTTSLTVGMTGELQLHDSAYIDFSADL